MPQFGSNRGVSASIRSAVTDSNGNLIVSPDDGWTGSPLGVAARNQVAIGVPNGTFNILPPDPVGEISQSNLLPYWDWIADDGFTAAMAYDTDAQTNSIDIDPTAVGTALGTAVLRTRIPITNDEGLSVRQYVSSSLIQQVKTGTGSRWTATLTSQYYDTTGAALGTPYIIGTFLERDIVTTNLAGYTNASGAIPSSAAELEIKYTLVVGTASPTYLLKVKSVMVATEYGAIGGGGGATTVPTWVGTVFESSGVFVPPTGVNYVTVVAIGAGQGGAGAAYRVSSASAGYIGGSAGATGYYALARDIYVGNVGTAGVSVGIGAGGSGGTATVISKAAGSATPTEFRRDTQTAGSDGGNTTFGTFLTVPGGRTAPTGYFDIASAAGATAGTVGAATGGNGGTGGTHTIASTNTGAPFIFFESVSSAGSAGIGSGGTGASGAAGAAAAGTAIAGAGGGGGGGTASISVAATAGAGGTAGPGGGGGGGGAVARWASTTATMTGTAGNGGNGVDGTGGGGGGGGALVISITSGATWTASSIAARASAGGNGGSGMLAVYWLENL